MRQRIQAVGLIRFSEGMFVADEFDNGDKHVVYHACLNSLKICLTNFYRKKFFPKKMEVVFKRQSDGIKFIIKTAGKRITHL